ncbi:hypothetical protein E4T48_05476 [Aureobasidium sp. EXF-10727]|nr:hypothetical protein E4T48_05476 [Aureobasidium sp. EXF-10727]KAI4730703.1 hypothetical protein E4T49_01626 [Aureobasidium sp. EXF-10728]
MKIFAVLAFVLAALFSTALVCAQNITYSTATSTVTKTVFHTVTTSVNIATLPGFAPHGPAFGSSTPVEDDPSVELKSMFAKTILLTSTMYSTEVDGVVVTSLSTVVAPVTSTDFQEVTSTATKHAGITVTSTTTSLIVSASTPSAAATSLTMPQEIAQMWGLNGSEHVEARSWLVYSVVLLGVAHYLFFAHH